MNGGTIKTNKFLALLELVEGYGFTFEAECLLLCVDVVDKTAIVGTGGARILYRCHLCRCSKFGLFGGNCRIFLGLSFSLFTLLAYTDVMRKILGFFRVENFLDSFGTSAASNVGDIIPFDLDRLVDGTMNTTVIKCLDLLLIPSP